MNGISAHPRIHGGIDGAVVMGEKIEDMRPFLHIFVGMDEFMPMVALLIFVWMVAGVIRQSF